MNCYLLQILVILMVFRSITLEHNHVKHITKSVSSVKKFIVFRLWFLVFGQ